MISRLPPPAAGRGDGPPSVVPVPDSARPSGRGAGRESSAHYVEPSQA